MTFNYGPSVTDRRAEVDSHMQHPPSHPVYPAAVWHRYRSISRLQGTFYIFP